MKKIISLIFCILFIFVIFITISFIVFFNLTPAQIGCSHDLIKNHNTKILNLSEMKLGNIFRDIIKFNSIKERDIVQNAFNENIEENYIQNNFKETYLHGKKNYSNLIFNQLIYSSKRVLTYSDKMLACIFNNIFSSFYENNNMEFLDGIKISVKELTITTKNSYAYLKLVCCADIYDKSKNNLKNYSYLIPKKIYFENLYLFNVSKKGRATLKPLSILINNDKDNIISKFLISYLIQVSKFNSEYEFNLQLGEIISNVIFNLGLIGTVNKNTNLSNFKESINLGISGVFNHGITVITQ